jgi:hypothetical protein
MIDTVAIRQCGFFPAQASSGRDISLIRSVHPRSTPATYVFQTWRMLEDGIITITIKNSGNPAFLFHSLVTVFFFSLSSI